MKNYLLVKKALQSFYHKDTSALLALFSNDAAFTDPHYPDNEMIGKEAIARGLQWAFANIKTFYFEDIHYMENVKENTVAVECISKHTLINDKTLEFHQVFVFTFKNGLIRRLRAYEPYGPSGMSGFMLRVSHLIF
jgi:ketosteroid isomerase-like protein